MRPITSRQNPLVARFRALAAAPDPTETTLLLDGAHLVGEARAAGVTLDVVAVAASHHEASSEEGTLASALDAEGIDVAVLPDPVFRSVSPVRTPSGIVAIASRQRTPAEAICAHPHALILAVVDVQDPGNVGALARTSEAGGATGLLACGASAHPFSWKAVRGSMGSALRLPIAGGLATADAVRHLEATGVTTVAAVPRGGCDPDAVDWRGAVALLLGGEGAGLPAAVVAGAGVRVSIPMAPTVESLNVGAAGAILLYAACRARHRGTTP